MYSFPVIVEELKADMIWKLETDQIKKQIVATFENEVRKWDRT